MNFVLTLIMALTLNLPTFAVEKYNKDSIFNIKSTWFDQNKKAQRLADFGKKKFLLTMIYTSCAHACPLNIHRVKEILNAAKNKNTPVVFVTFDPQRDTPAHNLDYMKKRKLDSSQWTFLTGADDAQTRELAIILGINYKDLGNGDFAHSNIIHVVSSEGLLLEKVEGFEAPIANVVKALDE